MAEPCCAWTAFLQRLVPADDGIPEFAGLLLIEEQLDVRAERSLIAFQREHVVGLFLDDLPGDLLLAAHLGGAEFHSDASIVTIAPLTVSRSRSSGMAVISFDLSATFLWPSTRRWRLEKAEIIWIGALEPPS